MNKIKLGILVSGSGTNLQAILDAIKNKQLNAEIKLVISNRPGVGALEKAASALIPNIVILHKNFATREAFEEVMIMELRKYGVEWIVLAGFMRVLTNKFLNAFPEKVINIHPALLPSFPGMDAQRQALDYGVKITGCSVHFVDSGMDTGPIIAQLAVPVLDTDNEETLRLRILKQEHILYPQVLQLIAERKVIREGRKVRIMK